MGQPFLKKKTEGRNEKCMYTLPKQAYTRQKGDKIQATNFSGRAALQGLRTREPGSEVEHKFGAAFTWDRKWPIWGDKQCHA
jgi:hypothetical protein